MGGNFHASNLLRWHGIGWFETSFSQEIDLRGRSALDHLQ